MEVYTINNARQLARIREKDYVVIDNIHHIPWLYHAIKNKRQPIKQNKENIGIHLTTINVMGFPT